MRATSGAIQSGVPAMLMVLAHVDAICRDTPKSASLGVPRASSRMFAALMSRWMMFLLCRYARPASAPRSTCATTRSSSGWSMWSIRSRSEPCAQ